MMQINTIQYNKVGSLYCICNKHELIPNSELQGLSQSTANLVIIIFTLNIRRSIPLVREMTAFVENQIVVALRFGLDSLANTIPAIQA